MDSGLLGGKPSFRLENPSIEYLELFALAAGLLTWRDEPELKNRQITIFCDNQAVVDMINDMSSKCGKCMNC